MVERLLEKNSNIEGEFSWEAPSNIALVKYWGKYGDQLPKNPSLSFTLNRSKTLTQVKYVLHKNHVNHETDFSFQFEGAQSDSFKQKLINYLKKITPLCPMVSFLKLSISSQNTFPHSAGIASSASSMAAMALTICSIEKELFPDQFESDEYFFAKASYLARLGSGSACRSVYGGAVSWGVKSNEYASELVSFDNIFKTYQNAILVVSTDKKSVTSRQGHALMEEHFYKEARFKQAKHNYSALVRTMEKGDLESFIQIVEIEALSLHAMMMTSEPSFLLLTPQSLHIINRIRAFRERFGANVCFTIDAGPNIHLLYPKRQKDQIVSFIKDELLQYCENGMWIDDEVGSGPKLQMGKR